MFYCDSLSVATCLLCTALNMYVTYGNVGVTLHMAILGLHREGFLLILETSIVTENLPQTYWNWCEKFNGKSLCLRKVHFTITNIHTVGIASVPRKGCLIKIKAPSGGKV